MYVLRHVVIWSTPSGNGRYKGDYAKTGVLYLMPKYISKYGRPLPYFMRYA